MSGIVGIVHFDREPVDGNLLGQMTAFMSFRGPDAQEIWIDGNVGFGYTLLKTTDEAEHESQPFTLDGRTWIVADARVDARRECSRNSKLTVTKISLRTPPMSS
jgi:asparagine synthase (glutamine-hydrolysing)